VNRNVAVLDIGTADLSSIIAALEAAGSKAIATNQRSKILDADGFVIYGASKLSSFMSALDKSKAAELVDTRLAGGKAVLGIGAGLHAMFETSAEDNEIAQGLAQWPGVIQKLESQSIAKAKVLVAKNSKLFQDVENKEFYFDQIEAVLEFSLQVDPPFVAPMVSYLNQDQSFIAAVENGPLAGISFYPEQSGEAGIALLRNWLWTI
jgi:glutamine amidotransferase